MSDLPLLYKDRRKEGETILRQAQLVQLHLLYVLDAICKKYNLRYFLCGGTLLGAIRHHGFIPWDDDLDVTLPEEDYKKFLKIAPQELPQDVTLHDMKKMSHVPSGGGYTKLRDVYSTYYEENQWFRTEDPMGIFLDVFALKPCPRLPKFLLKFLIDCLKFSDRRYHCKLDCCSRGLPQAILGSWIVLFLDLFRKTIRFFLKICCCIIPGQPRYWYHDFGLAYGKILMPTEILFPIDRKALFEDGEFPVPRDPDALLRIQYGDYMQIPPEDKRPRHAHLILPFQAQRAGLLHYPEADRPVEHE